MILRLSGLLLALLLLPAAAMAQQAGQVVALTPSAQLVGPGGTRTLRVGDAVPTGSVVRTGSSGRVQMMFPDGTKVVVAPKSSLTIDDAVFNARGMARTLSLSATGGAFRFITGTSPKSAYNVATPVATMGVRGTAFDFTVTGGSASYLLVYDGRVRICNQRRICTNVPGGCRAVSVDRNNAFTQPRTNAEKQRLLEQIFPLAANQATLRPEFRTDTRGCGRLRLLLLPGESVPGGGSGGDRGGGSRRSGNPAE